MPEPRIVPKSVGESVRRWALGLGLLAGSGALIALSCTDNSGGGKFVEPTHGTDGAAGSSSDGGPSDGATGGAGGAAGAASSGSGGAAGAAASGSGGATAGAAGASAAGSGGKAV